MTSQKIRAGMVGGGPGAFIGAVHRMAARLDGQIELVCGCFSSEAEKTRTFGTELGLDRKRVYPSFSEMCAQEALLPEHERMQFVSVVTPNHLHHPVSVAALSSGFHVLCDKPATLNLREAYELRAAIADSGRIFGLTYTYSGYAMVKQARQLVASGALGPIRNVQVEYLQGWLATKAERANNKQALWRTDPRYSGLGGAVADIGVHAFHLVEYVTQLQATQLCADLASFGPGRALDDDGCVLLRFDSGARGQLAFSQICAGEQNGLRLRVYGEQAGLEWDHREPDRLLLRRLDGSTTILQAGSEAAPHAAAYLRLPGGHPEGYVEAFANLYRCFAHAVRRAEAGAPVDYAALDLPSIEDGVRGMAFIEQAAASRHSNAKWLTLRT